MGVVTDADVMIEKARIDLKTSAESMNNIYTAIVVQLGDVYGADNYSEDFKLRVKKAQDYLLRARQCLGC